VVALEEEIEVELGGVPVIAIPDWIAVDEHGQACIVDYKSSKDQAGPRKPLQLGVYRAAVIAKLGYEPVWGLYYMARSAAVIPWDLRKYTPELIGEKFADFDSRERAGDYRPTPGDHCRYCPFKRDRCTYYNPETT
jgi:RecB family exonuclease